MIPLLSTIGRWLRGLVVIPVFTVVAIWYAAKPELAGMKYVGGIRYPESSGESPLDVYERLESEWLQSAGKSSPEVYRFVCERAFYDPICVTAWRDGERYWIRSSVALTGGDPIPTSHQWEKTHALSAKRWEQIRTIFSKRSVIDLNDGKEGKGEENVSFFDGSEWTLESVIDGQTRRVQIQDPFFLGNSGDDFVEAGRLMLKHGRVTVWNLF